MLALTPGGFLKEIVEDTTPVLGGDLDGDGHDISNVGTGTFVNLIVNDPLATRHDIAKIEGTEGYLTVLNDPTYDRIQFTVVSKAAPDPIRPVFNSAILGENYARFGFDGYGVMLWSDGTNVPDTNLYRSAVSILATDDNFAIVSKTKGYLLMSDSDNLRYGLKYGNAKAVGGSDNLALTNREDDGDLRFQTCPGGGGANEVDRMVIDGASGDVDVVNDFTAGTIQADNGFTGTGAYTNFTIAGGIITAAA